MEPYTYSGGPFSVSAERVNDKVFIRIYRDDQLLVEIVTSRTGARHIAEQITGVLW
jgi:hypothetical protein